MGNRDESERIILSELFAATGGPNWLRRRNWNTTWPLSYWQGAAFNDKGYLKELDLSLNNVDGEIPESLGQLTHLSCLYLDNNLLIGDVPKSLSALINLTKLSLHTNKMSGEIPNSFGQLTNLTELSLYGNQLTGEIPPSLGQLTNLTILSLHSNKLNGEIPASVGQLTNLTQLSLQSNQLTGAVPPGIGQLTNLTGLEFHSNQLSGENSGSMWLLLAGIPMRDLPLSVISMISSMHHNLKKVNMGDAGPGFTLSPDMGYSSPAIAKLDLQECNLIGVIPASVGKLSSLMWLSLGHNQLSGEIPSSLGQLSNLTRLSLRDNQLTGEIPASLGLLTKLSVLDLRDNQLGGELPLPVICMLSSMKCNFKRPNLKDAGPGFALPVNIGGLDELDPAIRKLDLSMCNLTGDIPASLSQLTGLERLYLESNAFKGGFEHIANLSQLLGLELDGFWAAFEDLPLDIAVADSLQVKLGYLRDRFDSCAEPLM